MNPMIDPVAVKLAVEKWLNFRKAWQARKGPPNKGDTQDFLGTMNKLSRELADTLQINDPAQLIAMGEMCTHIAGLIQNPDFFRVQG